MDKMRQTNITTTAYQSPRIIASNYIPTNINQIPSNLIASRPVTYQSINPQSYYQPIQSVITSKIVSKSPVARNDSPTVYCPVCHMEYSHEQTDNHIEKHNMSSTVNLKTVDLNQTKDSIETSNKVIYPLIEPLEFWTKELTEVAKKNSYAIKINEQNKKQVKKKYVADCAVQTLSKPNLQEVAHETDFYNCFDNAFNSNASFTAKDLFEYNSVLASKRQLTEWELLHHRK